MQTTYLSAWCPNIGSITKCLKYWSHWQYFNIISLGNGISQTMKNGGSFNFRIYVTFGLNDVNRSHHISAYNCVLFSWQSLFLIPIYLCDHYRGPYIFPHFVPECQTTENMVLLLGSRCRGVELGDCREFPVILLHASTLDWLAMDKSVVLCKKYQKQLVTVSQKTLTTTIQMHIT